MWRKMWDYLFDNYYYYYIDIVWLVNFSYVTLDIESAKPPLNRDIGSCTFETERPPWTRLTTRATTGLVIVRIGEIPIREVPRVILPG